MNITLPYPPSANHYWMLAVIKKSIRKFIGKKGKEFRQKVLDIIPENVITYTDRLEVSIIVFPPDKRKRDLDNILKPTLDALEVAKVYENDNLIDKLIVTRGEVVKGGKLEIKIREIK